MLLLFLITEIEEYSMEVLCKVRRLFGNICNLCSILVFSVIEARSEVSTEILGKQHFTASEYKFLLKVGVIFQNDSMSSAVLSI